MGNDIIISLDSISASLTDLKRIQSAHNLFRDFGADKTRAFITFWSGCRVQARVQARALLVIWQSLRRFYLSLFALIAPRTNTCQLFPSLRKPLSLRVSQLPSTKFKRAQQHFGRQSVALTAAFLISRQHDQQRDQRFIPNDTHTRYLY